MIPGTLANLDELRDQGRAYERHTRAFNAGVEGKEMWPWVMHNISNVSSPRLTLTRRGP